MSWIMTALAAFALGVAVERGRARRRERSGRVILLPPRARR